MIPKIIHYCWFGRNTLPKSAQKCIESWKFFFPDYEIKEWNEDNFDVNIIPYTTEAYNAKKYAFVSDFARFWILHNEGGVYFDTDVEVVRDMRPLVGEGPFMGFELNPVNNVNRKMRVNPGLGLGVNVGHHFYKEIIDLYSNMHWVSYKDSNIEMPTVVDYTTSMLIDKGLKEINSQQTIEGIHIYLEDVFCPISIADGKLRITDNTFAIHWFDQSWQSPLRKYGRKVLLKLGGSRLKNLVKSIMGVK
jgi:mannosyltransferase OCH1-like enzyme